jgi:hypothetical protein
MTRHDALHYAYNSASEHQGPYAATTGYDAYGMLHMYKQRFPAMTAMWTWSFEQTGPALFDVPDVVGLMSREQPAARACTRYPAGLPSNRPHPAGRVVEPPPRPQPRPRPAMTGPAAAAPRPRTCPRPPTPLRDRQQQRRTADPSAMARCWLCPPRPCG